MFRLLYVKERTPTMYLSDDYFLLHAWQIQFKIENWYSFEIQLIQTLIDLEDIMYLFEVNMFDPSLHSLI